MRVDVYTHKKRWKTVLAVLALLIIAVILWYTNRLVKSVAEQETAQVRLWAEAMEQHAEMMHYAEKFFGDVSEQEHLRVELLARAYQQVLDFSNNKDMGVYLDIIRNNISIPLIITNANGDIIFSNNLPEDQRDKKVFDEEMKAAYSKFPPIMISEGLSEVQWLYYNESLIYTELKTVVDEMFAHFMSDVTLNSVGAPVIITDTTFTKVISFGNIDSLSMQDPVFVSDQIALMQDENQPLEVNFPEWGKVYIFYRLSDLTRQLRYYPISFLVVVAVFLLIAYLLFSYARRSEQNRVWAGMAKETAHQLGTPLSSLMGWVELMKMQDEPFEGVGEIEKDVERLQVIADRFSKIGSVPKLEDADITALSVDTIDYMKHRFSKNFIFDVNLPDHPVILPLVPSLFCWVLENLTKNAIDAMGDKGTITFDLKEEDDNVIIDFSDTGKGMTKSMMGQVFNPGITTKKRGWGLGLTLSKRIIKDYHKGKIFVKSSVVGKGTTFRIVLNKK